MSARRSREVTKAAAAYREPLPRPPRKSRGPRVRLTHFEIKRGAQLRMRIAVADDALAEAGDELGALIKRIAPSTRTAIIETSPDHDARREEEEFIVSSQHGSDDVAYHAGLRAHLTALFGSLCNEALSDALDIIRTERARRVEGVN